MDECVGSSMNVLPIAFTEDIENKLDAISDDICFLAYIFDPFANYGHGNFVYLWDKSC